MGASRKIPDIQKQDRFEVLGLAGLFPLLSGFFCCYITISSPKHTFSDWFSSILEILMSIGLLLTAIYFFSRATRIFRETRSWFKNTATAETTIVDRQEIINDQNDIDYAYSYGQYLPRGHWYLILESIPSQLAIKPEEMSVLVSINESQYKKYANRNKAKICYSKEDPFVFLLEDEV